MWPETVEAVVRTHPDVADVLVRGVDDAEWGQIVEALVVPVAGAVPTIDALRAHVKVDPSRVHGTEAADTRRPRSREPRSANRSAADRRSERRCERPDSSCSEVAERTCVRYNVGMLTELVEDMERFTELEVEELEVEELVELSDRALADRIEALELRRRATEAKLATAVAIAAKRNLAAADGHRSMAAFLRASLNWSTTEANRFLGLSRAVDNVAGFRRRVVCRPVRNPAGDRRSPRPTATRGSEIASRSSRRSCSNTPNSCPTPTSPRRVDHFVAQADSDGAHDDRDGNVEGRSAAVLDVGSSLHVTASGGDALTTAEMIAIHERYCDREYAQDLDVRRSRYGDDAEQP